MVGKTFCVESMIHTHHRKKWSKAKIYGGRSVSEVPAITNIKISGIELGKQE